MKIEFAFRPAKFSIRRYLNLLTGDGNESK
jgi:hypothetical protein